MKLMLICYVLKKRSSVAFCMAIFGKKSHYIIQIYACLKKAFLQIKKFILTTRVG